MSDKKTIFVCEFITAGGFVGQPLAAGLVSEGSLMRDQLCQELSESNDYSLISMHDARLNPAPDISNSLPVERSFETAFTTCLKQADWIWLIAPECDDILLDLTQQCEAENVPVIGASSDIVDLAADKLKMVAWLTDCQIDTPLTFSLPGWQAKREDFDPTQSWLAKPIKGVGCEDIVVLPDRAAVDTWLRLQAQETLSNYFLQAEVQHSQSASLSMLCHNGHATLLSCNRLVSEQVEGTIKLKQIEVNGFAEYWTSFQRLADTIASKLPHMRAYLGVDVMFDPQTGALLVLELNPRLSSSYVGLAKATGQNIAQCLLDAYFRSCFEMPETLRRPTIVNLD